MIGVSRYAVMERLWDLGWDIQTAQMASTLPCVASTEKTVVPQAVLDMETGDC